MTAPWQPETFIRKNFKNVFIELTNTATLIRENFSLLNRRTFPLHKTFSRDVQRRFHSKLSFDHPNWVNYYRHDIDLEQPRYLEIKIYEMQGFMKYQKVFLLGLYLIKFVV